MGRSGNRKHKVYSIRPQHTIMVTKLLQPHKAEACISKHCTLGATINDLGEEEIGKNNRRPFPRKKII